MKEGLAGWAWQQQHAALSALGILADGKTMGLTECCYCPEWNSPAPALSLFPYHSFGIARYAECAILSAGFSQRMATIEWQPFVLSGTIGLACANLVLDFWKCMGRVRD